VIRGPAGGARKGPRIRGVTIYVAREQRGSLTVVLRGVEALSPPPLWAMSTKTAGEGASPRRFAARARVAALQHMSPDRADVAVAAEHADQVGNLDHGALATPRAPERKRLDRQPIELLTQRSHTFPTTHSRSIALVADDRRACRTTRPFRRSGRLLIATSGARIVVCGGGP
jgi:hypothetical protein